LGGYPLVAWSIVAGKLMDVGPIVVSTDNEEVEEVASRYGIKCHRRGLNQTISTDTDVIRDYLQGSYEVIVYLRPTTPFRDIEVLKHAKDVFRWGRYYSLRSMHQMTEPCTKMYDEDFVPLSKIHDLANSPSEEHPPTFHPNGYIDITRTNRISEGLFQNPFKELITEKVIDIDTEDDWSYAEWWLHEHGHPLLVNLKEAYGSK